jgi:eukaryotic-like serine/threonine-protein kinase
VIACPVCHTECEEAGSRFCSRCGSSIQGRPSAEGADAWIGRVVEGRYRVQARIGTGGMGAVYRVEHVRMGKVAAMKVLHRELASDEQVVKRFRREVEAVSRLNHPNIVQTFDFGYWEGLLYLIMEYVKGEDLGALIRREGAMGVPRALAIGIQVCSALDEAHHLGVVHRDLKPENIVCARRRDEEHAKVLDFGLAKLRERPEIGEITGAGNLVGTPYFMSPEQVRSENVDHRTDLYSLGATLYRMISGQFPFDGTSPMGIMSRHLTDKVAPPSTRAPDRDIPPQVDRLILRAMAKNRDDRFETAADMRHELESILGITSGERSRRSRLGLSDELVPMEEHTGDSTGVVRLGREDWDEFERQQKRRRRVMSFVVTPLLLGGLGLGAWGAYRFMKPRPATSEKEPNDIATMATLLPRGKPVSGFIGKPRPSGEPDFDYYRIPPGDRRRAVTARLTGIPDVDLVLELFDDRGQRLARSDGGRVGEGEWVGPTIVGGGEVFVRARPVWTSGEAPNPGSPVPYELTVDWGPPKPDFELEPNDTPDTANPIDKEGRYTAYHATPEDEDWFAIRVPPGFHITGEAEGSDGIDIVVLIGEKRRRVDAAGIGEDEEFTATPGKDGVVLVGVAEQAPKSSSKKPSAPPERDEPYTLKIKFRRTEKP